MEWVIPDRSVQSSGACLQSIVDAFGELRRAVSKLFAESGVGVLGRDGVVQIDPNAWNPIEIELDVLRRMRDRVGEATLYSVGVAIPAAISLPPQVVDVDSALAMLDVAYHLNHGRNGAPLFDVTNGTMA